MEEGADYKPHWSLLPVGPVAVPAVREAAATTNPIDAFVRARLEQEGLAPAPRASAETIVRRLALNLTGLPPTPAEIDAFVADRSAQAVQRAADRYLASPAYGERMALRLGWTWRATPTPTATRTTSNATCRPIATG